MKDLVIIPQEKNYVISLLGNGKMTLTEQAHNDLEVKAHFEKKYLWIYVLEPFLLEY